MLWDFGTAAAARLFVGRPANQRHSSEHQKVTRVLSRFTLVSLEQETTHHAGALGIDGDTEWKTSCDFLGGNDFMIDEYVSVKDVF